MQREGKTAQIYINVSTGSKIASIAGTLACMMWKGTPYYTLIDYDNTKKDPSDGLPNEKIISITQLPVYSIDKPRTESLLILSSQDLVMFLSKVDSYESSAWNSIKERIGILWKREIKSNLDWK